MNELAFWNLLPFMSTPVQSDNDNDEEPILQKSSPDYHLDINYSRNKETVLLQFSPKTATENVSKDLEKKEDKNTLKIASSDGTEQSKPEMLQLPRKLEEKEKKRWKKRHYCTEESSDRQVKRHQNPEEGIQQKHSSETTPISDHHHVKSKKEKKRKHRKTHCENELEYHKNEMRANTSADATEIDNIKFTKDKKRRHKSKNGEHESDYRKSEKVDAKHSTETNVTSDCLQSKPTKDEEEKSKERSAKKDQKKKLKCKEDNNSNAESSVIDKNPQLYFAVSSKTGGPPEILIQSDLTTEDSVAVQVKHLSKRVKHRKKKKLSTLALDEKCMEEIPPKRTQQIKTDEIVEIMPKKGQQHIPLNASPTTEDKTETISVAVFAERDRKEKKHKRRSCSELRRYRHKASEKKKIKNDEFNSARKSQSMDSIVKQHASEVSVEINQPAGDISSKTNKKASTKKRNARDNKEALPENKEITNNSQTKLKTKTPKVKAHETDKIAEQQVTFAQQKSDRGKLDYFKLKFKTNKKKLQNDEANAKTPDKEKKMEIDDENLIECKTVHKKNSDNSTKLTKRRNNKKIVDNNEGDADGNNKLGSKKQNKKKSVPEILQNEGLEEHVIEGVHNQSTNLKKVESITSEVPSNKTRSKSKKREEKKAEEETQPNPVVSETTATRTGYSSTSDNSVLIHKLSPSLAEEFSKECKHSSRRKSRKTNDSDMVKIPKDELRALLKKIYRPALRQSKTLYYKIPNDENLTSINPRKEVSFSHLNLNPVVALYTLNSSFPVNQHRCNHSVDTANMKNASQVPPCLLFDPPTKERKPGKLRKKPKSSDYKSVVSEAITKREKCHYVNGKRYPNRSIKNSIFIEGVIEKSRRNFGGNASGTVGFAVGGFEPPKGLISSYTSSIHKPPCEIIPPKKLHTTVLSVVEIKPTFQEHLKELLWTKAEGVKVLPDSGQAQVNPPAITPKLKKSKKFLVRRDCSKSSSSSTGSPQRRHILTTKRDPIRNHRPSKDEKSRKSCHPFMTPHQQVFTVANKPFQFYNERREVERKKKQSVLEDDRIKLKELPQIEMISKATSVTELIQKNRHGKHLVGVSETKRSSPTRTDTSISDDQRITHPFLDKKTHRRESRSNSVTRRERSSSAVKDLTSLGVERRRRDYSRASSVSSREPSTGRTANSVEISVKVDATASTPKLLVPIQDEEKYKRHSRRRSSSKELGSTDRSCSPIEKRIEECRSPREHSTSSREASTKRKLISEKIKLPPEITAPLQGIGKCSRESSLSQKSSSIRRKVSSTSTASPSGQGSEEQKKYRSSSTPARLIPKKVDTASTPSKSSVCIYRLMNTENRKSSSTERTSSARTEKSSVMKPNEKKLVASLISKTATLHQTKLPDSTRRQSSPPPIKIIDNKATMEHSKCKTKVLNVHPLQSKTSEKIERIKNERIESFSSNAENEFHKTSEGPPSFLKCITSESEPNSDDVMSLAKITEETSSQNSVKSVKLHQRDTDRKKDARSHQTVNGISSSHSEEMIGMINLKKSESFKISSAVKNRKEAEVSEKVLKVTAYSSGKQSIDEQFPEEGIVRKTNNIFQEKPASMLGYVSAGNQRGLKNSSLAEYDNNRSTDFQFSNEQSTLLQKTNQESSPRSQLRKLQYYKDSSKNQEQICGVQSGIQERKDIIENVHTGPDTQAKVVESLEKRLKKSIGESSCPGARIISKRETKSSDRSRRGETNVDEARSHRRHSLSYTRSRDENQREKHSNINIDLLGKMDVEEKRSSRISEDKISGQRSASKLPSLLPRRILDKHLTLEKDNNSKTANTSSESIANISSLKKKNKKVEIKEDLEQHIDSNSFTEDEIYFLEQHIKNNVLTGLKRFEGNEVDNCKVLVSGSKKSLADLITKEVAKALKNQSTCIELVNAPKLKQPVSHARKPLEMKVKRHLSLDTSKRLISTPSKNVLTNETERRRAKSLTKPSITGLSAKEMLKNENCAKESEYIYLNNHQQQQRNTAKEPKVTKKIPSNIRNKTVLYVEPQTNPFSQPDSKVELKTSNQSPKKNFVRENYLNATRRTKQNFKSPEGSKDSDKSKSHSIGRVSSIVGENSGDKKQVKTKQSTMQVHSETRNSRSTHISEKRQPTRILEETEPVRSSVISRSSSANRPIVSSILFTKNHKDNNVSNFEKRKQYGELLRKRTTNVRSHSEEPTANKESNINRPSTSGPTENRSLAADAKKNSTENKKCSKTAPVKLFQRTSDLKLHENSSLTNSDQGALRNINENVYQTFALLTQPPNVTDVFQNTSKSAESFTNMPTGDFLFSYNNLNRTASTKVVNSSSSSSSKGRGINNVKSSCVFHVNEYDDAVDELKSSSSYTKLQKRSLSYRKERESYLSNASKELFDTIEPQVKKSPIKYEHKIRDSVPDSLYRHTKMKETESKSKLERIARQQLPLLQLCRYLKEEHQKQVKQEALDDDRNNIKNRDFFLNTKTLLHDTSDNSNSKKRVQLPDAMEENDDCNTIFKMDDHIQVRKKHKQNGEALNNAFELNVGITKSRLLSCDNRNDVSTTTIPTTISFDESGYGSYKSETTNHLKKLLMLKRQEGVDPDFDEICTEKPFRINLRTVIDTFPVVSNSDKKRNVDWTPSDTYITDSDSCGTGTPMQGIISPIPSTSDWQYPIADSNLLSPHPSDLFKLHDEASDLTLNAEVDCEDVIKGDSSRNSKDSGCFSMKRDAGNENRLRKSQERQLHTEQRVILPPKKLRVNEEVNEDTESTCSRNSSSRNWCFVNAKPPPNKLKGLIRTISKQFYTSKGTEQNDSILGMDMDQEIDRKSSKRSFFGRHSKPKCSHSKNSSPPAKDSSQICCPECSQAVGYHQKQVDQCHEYARKVRLLSNFRKFGRRKPYNNEFKEIPLSVLLGTPIPRSPSESTQSEPVESSLKILEEKAISKTSSPKKGLFERLKQKSMERFSIGSQTPTTSFTISGQSSEDYFEKHDDLSFAKGNLKTLPENNVTPPAVSYITNLQGRNLEMQTGGQQITAFPLRIEDTSRKLTKTFSEGQQKESQEETEAKKKGEAVSSASNSCCPHFESKSSNLQLNDAFSENPCKYARMPHEKLIQRNADPSSTEETCTHSKNLYDEMLKRKSKKASNEEAPYCKDCNNISYLEQLQNKEKSDYEKEKCSQEINRNDYCSLSHHPAPAAPENVSYKDAFISSIKSPAPITVNVVIPKTFRKSSVSPTKKATPPESLSSKKPGKESSVGNDNAHEPLWREGQPCMNIECSSSSCELGGEDPCKHAEKCFEKAKLKGTLYIPPSIRESEEEDEDSIDSLSMEEELEVKSPTYKSQDLHEKNKIASSSPETRCDPQGACIRLEDCANSLKKSCCEGKCRHLDKLFEQLLKEQTKMTSKDDTKYTDSKVLKKTTSESVSSLKTFFQSHRDELASYESSTIDTNKTKKIPSKLSEPSDIPQQKVDEPKKEIKGEISEEQTKDEKKKNKQQTRKRFSLDKFTKKQFKPLPEDVNPCPKSPERACSVTCDCLDAESSKEKDKEKPQKQKKEAETHQQSQASSSRGKPPESSKDSRDGGKEGPSKKSDSMKALKVLKDSLTDKQLFEKLLDSYEREEKIVERLSADEEFIQSQLELVKSKESIEALVKKGQEEEEQPTSTVSLNKSEEVLRMLNMQSITDVYDDGAVNVESKKRDLKRAKPSAETKPQKKGLKDMMTNLFKQDNGDMKEMLAARDETFRRHSENVSYIKSAASADDADEDEEEDDEEEGDESRDTSQEGEVDESQKVKFSKGKELFKKEKELVMRDDSLMHKAKIDSGLGQSSIDSIESNMVRPSEIGRCFLRGFRSDNMTLNTDTCLLLGSQERVKDRSDTESVIDFSERDSPLDYLLALGFSIDEASNAIKDDDVKLRLYSAINEAHVWVNQISTLQGTLLYLVAYKAKPRTMRYFLQLVEAIVNRRINDAVKLDGFIRVLEKVEDGDLTMLSVVGTHKIDSEENEEKMVKKQLRELFIHIYKIAEDEALLKKKPLSQKEITLLRILAARYRAGLHPHLELIARYIGQGLLLTEIQLEAAMIYLSRLDTADVKLPEFEQYCGIYCKEKEIPKKQKERKKTSKK